jgi:hypothetical protein
LTVVEQGLVERAGVVRAWEAQERKRAGRFGIPLERPSVHALTFERSVDRVRVTVVVSFGPFLNPDAPTVAPLALAERGHGRAVWYGKERHLSKFERVSIPGPVLQPGG